MYGALLSFYLYERSREQNLKKIQNHPVVHCLAQCQNALEFCKNNMLSQQKRKESEERNEFIETFDHSEKENALQETDYYLQTLLRKQLKKRQREQEIMEAKKIKMEDNR
jgi:hypothetical protein